METSEFIEWQRTRVLRRTGKEPSVLTLRTHASALRVCADAAGVTDLEMLATHVESRALAESLLDKLSARMTSGSVRTKVQALRIFGQFACAKGWIASVALLPTDSPPANPQKPITIYNDDEMALLLGAARGRGLRWWCFVMTLAHTGRRVGEILAVEWNWLNLSAETPHIHLPHTKNGRQAYVPLSRVLVEDVFTDANIAALKGETRVGANRAFSRDLAEYPFPWTYSSVARIFVSFCGAVGIEHRGFHCLRHTKATNLLAKGVPIQAVSSLLGHASVQTTDRIYNHANALAYSQYID